MKETRTAPGWVSFRAGNLQSECSIARGTSRAPIQAISSIASAMNQYAHDIHDFEVADCVSNAVRRPAAQVTKRSDAAGDFCDFRVTRIRQLNTGSS
jgi:hypothetical protein